MQMQMQMQMEKPKPTTYSSYSSQESLEYGSYDLYGDTVVPGTITGVTRQLVQPEPTDIRLNQQSVGTQQVLETDKADKPQQPEPAAISTQDMRQPCCGCCIIM